MIVVSLLKFKKGQYWSPKKLTYFPSDDIASQFWLHKNKRCDTTVITLKDAIDFVKNNPGDSKKHRNAFFRFCTNEVPLKGYVNMDKWTGLIYVDLDFTKDPKIKNLTREQNNLLYKQLDLALRNIIPNNYCYMERSSTWPGIHALFYFNCIKDQEHHDYYAAYVYHVFRNEIDTYIKNFSHIFTDKECLKSSGKSNVFDDVYKRPYQKLYITSIDYLYYDVNGDCSGIIFEMPQKETAINFEDSDEFAKLEKHNIVKRNVDIKYVTSKKKYSLDHNDRYYVLTALKKYLSDKDYAFELWCAFCKQITLYKRYTTTDFINMFDKLWDSLDISQGHIEVLRKYGFDVDDSIVNIDLGNGYLGDYRDSILQLLKPGINVVQAPTGSGKTCFWTDYNEELLYDMLNISKPILIVEPLNSIIETKYDNKVEIVIGSKTFPKHLYNYGMYVTNYNKLLKKGINNKWEVRVDVIEFLSQFGLIVIDESHIILKDSFRCDVLIPFIRTINEIGKNTKVILQTATPMEESILFSIQRTIICHKKNNIKTKIIYRKCQEDKFNISQLTCLVNYYVNHKGRKVYIYWNNGSLAQLRAFKAFYTNPDKVAIYHKRNMGEESMNRINKFHRLSYSGGDDQYDYEVLLSSVYFGVGNDLDDETDAAVILIGNNTWQEDIQAIGRWRRSKDIEVCQIILPNEYDFIDNSAKEAYDFGTIKKKEYNQMLNMWNDKLNKDKSVIINNQTFYITSVDDINILSIMKACSIYHSQFDVKVSMLSNEYYNFDVREDYDKVLECNEDFTDENKSYWDSVKQVRNNIKRDIIEGKIEYDKINEDSNIERFSKLWKRLKKYEINKIVSIDYITTNSHYNILKCWLDYYERLLDRSIDYPEFYALLWYREINKENLNYKKINGCEAYIEIGDYEYMKAEFDKFCAYIYYVTNKNKSVEYDYEIKSLSYISKFKWYCHLFCLIPDELIDKFFETGTLIENTKDESNNLYDYNLNLVTITTPDDIKEQIVPMIKNMSKVNKLFNIFCNDVKREQKLGGEKSSPKKKVTITDKFKKCAKYNLRVGQTFDSCSALAEYANVNNTTVTRWISKLYVIKE